MATVGETIPAEDLKGITLERHLRNEERKHPGARGVFTRLVSQICLAAKIVNAEVNKAGLVEILGLTGKTNVQGEEVQKLDEYANEVIRRALDHTGTVSAMASEEMEAPYLVPGSFVDDGQYVVVYDPLDGSSNIDVNVSIGSIFSILRRRSPDGGPATIDDFLQKGSEQLCAGYVIYGSSTMLVYTTGNGVNGFTLDPSVGEFFLSHPNIQIPKRGKIYSINEGNSVYWFDEVARYIRHLKSEDKASGRPYSGRYIGSLVADFHRNLLKGGVFLYPGDKKSKSGKLRLIYECNPMAFIVEQAGGASSDGAQRTLDIVPEKLHQRVPLVIGSREDVAEAERFLQGKAVV
ncbi:MAG: class 1 fructose-bisphosphatase [Candidatus Tectomicrobia bacterium]|uniref:Fructose-1,6-bisphosphatase class 1 n=1 Tax=Tectimicrobiota bacterium TaxID=2528274 RepID=A0A932HYS0_UNCTE|nr:class 1 fructose-bisphosphatase [Candidatus Tectomicrobia bacterium]